MLGAMSTSSRIARNLRRGAVAAALASTAVLCAPPVAGASYGSALAGQAATFTGDGASDTLTFAESGGLLNHNQTGGGLTSTRSTAIRLRLPR